ncbi:thioesterase [Paracoccus suum]|uniref:Thioesterase n=1 Tax=Paracoccus suum TaxID=2259340 RepID=A0A344PIG9_9RHOB|nr:acyl-CoA thioesterase [Paracoccus suum]AXC49174.1 thioesterase [Paracoccus suum]
MYPILRFARHIAAARRLPALGPFAPHVSQHRCWPWDIDPWLEMNNGRTLTLYDLGRMALSVRTGLAQTARERRWGLAVAGVSVRYRRRIKSFERFQMVSRLIGWDERFFYMEQSMWKGGECANNMLLRSAVTRGASGIVPTAEVAAAMGLPAESPPLPEWVRAWIAADAERPWPPEGAPDAAAE